MKFNKDDFIYHTSYGTGRVTSVILPAGVETDLADVSIDFKIGEIKTFSKYRLSGNRRDSATYRGQPANRR